MDRPPWQQPQHQPPEQPEWVYTVTPYWQQAPFAPYDKVKPPKKPMSTTGFVVQATAAAMLGFPFAAAGLFLCATVIGIVPGIGLIIAAGMPLGYVMRKRSQELVAWKFRDQPMPNDMPKPWEE